MRIISKEKDYYDVIQGYGQDQSIVYHREETVLDCQSALKPMKVSIAKNHEKISVMKALFQYLGLEIPKRLFERKRLIFPHYIPGHRIKYWMIGFCGQWIPCVEIIRDQDTSYGNGLVSEFLYPETEEKINAAKNELGIYAKDVESFLNIPVKESHELFHYFNTPILIFDVGDRGRKIMDGKAECLWTNSRLAEMQFYRHIDAFTAFQSLSQYLTGVLGVGSPETVSISDRDMRNAKGFNEKSFKKSPTKKKKR